MKKIAILGFVSSLLLFGGTIVPAHAEETTVTSKQELKKEQSQNYNEKKVTNGQKVHSHDGEKPLFTQKDPKTGVVVEAYPSKVEVENRLTDTPNWDYRGEEYWNMNGKGLPEYDSTYPSGGGDYCFTVPAHFASFIQSGYAAVTLVSLWENDYGWTEDDYVMDFKVWTSTQSIDYIARDIGAWVDGPENQAEFYTVHYPHYSVSGGKLYGVSYWD